MQFRAVAGILLKRVLPIFVGMSVLVLVIVWLAGVLEEKIEPAWSPVAVRRIDAGGDHGIYAVQAVTKKYFEEAVGTLKSAKRTEISARILAPIDRILANAGQTVQPGDKLVELDRRALETQLSQVQASLVAAQASLRQAEGDYERAVQLLQKKSISRDEMGQRRANVEIARANLNHAQQAVSEAEVMLSYTTITAPKAGMIVDRLAEEGDMAQPGKPLLILYDPATLRLEVPVMENLAIRLKLGDPLTVQIDALDNRQVPAEIDEIVPQAETASRSFLVKVKLPRSEDLFEGMFGRLKIPMGTRRHLCLHTAAIQTIGQLDFVDIVDSDGTLERRFVRVGRYGDPDHREVLSGLKAGERVLLKQMENTKPDEDG